MKYQDVERVLNQIGLREVSRSESMIGFSEIQGPADIYINTETKTARNTLILHPRFEDILSQLVKVQGVYQGRSCYRSSDSYVDFPLKGMAVGGKSHYGLSFCFSNKEAVEGFLKTAGFIQ